jgi:hypothetical protein
MANKQSFMEGQILTSPLFNEPMRVETVRAGGDGLWTVGLVGTRSERFRKVTLTAQDLEGLAILDAAFTYDGDGRLLRLGLQAYSLGIAWEFDPYFGLSISRVDPLPHQLEAVYDYLLKLARVRFLLADDAGAGKTIMAGLGHIVHERLFAVELSEDADLCLREPNMLGNFSPTSPPDELPAVVFEPEPSTWLHTNALKAFLEETQKERLAEVERIAVHVELSLAELLQRADEEIGKANEDKDQGIVGADGRLAQAENRHSELLARRDRRRHELERERSLSLQAVERIASVLVLPHPERSTPEVMRLQPSLETEATAMQVVMEHEQSQGRQVSDVHEQNLGYDITSLDLKSGELRLVEVKGLAAATGTILLTPNERRVAEDRRDCYWLYVVTNCLPAAPDAAQAGSAIPVLQEPIKDPARFPWHEVSKVAHYRLEVNAMTRPMQVREEHKSYGEDKP